ncbi:hypothetical protein LINPERHAP1_LOCUS40243 [Linum perenne]
MLNSRVHEITEKVGDDQLTKTKEEEQLQAAHSEESEEQCLPSLRAESTETGTLLVFLLQFSISLLEPDKLWVRIITSKYLRETVDGPVLLRKSGGSPLWRGIRTVWHEMSTAYQHSIRNGRDTVFWTARWLDSDVRLAYHALVSLTDDELSMSVADTTNEEGNCNWDLLCRVFPQNIACLIAGMEPPSRDDREDEMI